MASKKDEIIHAIHSGNLSHLKDLITPDNVHMKDRSGYSLLHIATNADQVAIAQWLLTHCSLDVNAQCNGHTVLSLALAKANYALFDFYLEHKAECIGRNQLNLLHEAVNKNRYDIVERLVERGADPNQTTHHQLHTPLTIAVTQRNKRIALLLLESGACANLPDKKGNTAVHLACGLCDPELIHVLLDNTECDLKLKNHAEETPLDLFWTACLRENRSVDSNLIGKLVDMGALFSMPWNNYTLTAQNHLFFVKAMSVLCHYKLNDLFVSDRPLFARLLVQGWWRNSLIVAIKSAIIDNKDTKELYKAVETIVLSDEMGLSESDLCSTFYMYDEVDEFEVYKMLKRLFAAPFSLKSLSRMSVRKRIGKFSVEAVDGLKLSDQLKNYLIFETKKSKFS